MGIPFSTASAIQGTSRWCSGVKQRTLLLTRRYRRRLLLSGYGFCSGISRVRNHQNNRYANQAPGQVFNSPHRRPKSTNPRSALCKGAIQTNPSAARQLTTPLGTKPVQRNAKPSKSQKSEAEESRRGWTVDLKGRCSSGVANLRQWSPPAPASESGRLRYSRLPFRV